ncbi:hypothetical protein CS8_101460 [Cupriavidus sp. 8B]
MVSRGLFSNVKTTVSQFYVAAYEKFNYGHPHKVGGAAVLQALACAFKGRPLVLTATFLISPNFELAARIVH